MCYADYTFYITEYCGVMLTEDDFGRLSIRASDFISYYTRNKANPEDDNVKKCCCALAERYSAIEEANAKRTEVGGDITSQTVGSYSVTYGKGNGDFISSVEAECADICRRYLSAYLYRGGRVGV